MDRYDETWKERLVADKTKNPMNMLLAHFEGTELPQAQELTQPEIDAVKRDISERYVFLAGRQMGIIGGLLSSLGAMPPEERAVYGTIINGLLFRREY